MQESSDHVKIPDTIKNSDVLIMYEWLVAASVC